MFQIILADCPWRYADEKNNDPNMGGITYPTMTAEELGKLQIKKIADKNCLLFMWATMPLLPEAIYVMAQWGFKYTTCAFVWVKLNPTGIFEKQEKDVILRKGVYSGLGHWTNGNIEVCLLGKKGIPKRLAKNVKQVIFFPRGKHSQKPDETYDRILQLTGDLPRVELFARQKREGWITIGNEINTTVEEYLNTFYNTSVSSQEALRAIEN